MTLKRHRLLLNYVFILCLIVLVLNDHFLKWEYSNWITGKLSDLAGMIVLPFLITYFNPKHVRFNIVFSALLFIFWKSSLSTNAIAFYNKYALIKTSRIIDYTDFIALAMLPLAYFLIKKVLSGSTMFSLRTRLHSAVVLLPAIFILMSETPPKRYFLSHTDSNFICHRCKVDVNMSQNEVLEKLESFNIKLDTSLNTLNQSPQIVESDSLRYFTIPKFVIDSDTLYDVGLSLYKARNNKTTISLNGFDYKKKISNQKMKRKLQRYFRKVINEYFKNL